LKSILSALLQIVCALQLHSQHFEWAKDFKTNSTTSFFPMAKTVTVGKNGEVFLGGYYVESLNVNGNVLDGDTKQHGFLIRLDPSGQILSAKSFGPHGGSIEYLESDQEGNIFFMGGFGQQLILGSDTLTADNVEGAYYVAKYSPAADTFLWAKSFPAIAHLPATDIYGNFYFINSIPWSPLGLSDEFLVKLDANGNLVYKSLLYHRLNTTYFGPGGITPDRFGNVYVSAYATEGALVGSIPVSSTVTTDFAALVIVKCDSFGTPFRISNLVEIPAWQGIAGNGTMITDGAGSLYHNIYGDKLSLIKYDSAGSIIFALRDDKINMTISSLQLDEHGNLYATGIFKGNFVLNQLRFDSPPSAQSIFLAKFNQLGDLLWRLQGQNEFWDSALDLGRDRATGDLYISGFLQSSAASFGETVLSVNGQHGTALIAKAKDSSFPSALILELGNDTTLCPGSGIYLMAPGFASYTWHDGSNSSTFYAASPGKYYLTATDFSGREYKDSLTISACIPPVVPDPNDPEEPETPPVTDPVPIPLVFPNVITPNKDPYNEYFVIKNLDTSKLNYLTVFDRWGIPIFTTNEYQNDWNGSHLTNGIYYYKLIDGRDNKTYRGWLHVLKQD